MADNKKQLTQEKTRKRLKIAREFLNGSLILERGIISNRGQLLFGFALVVLIIANNYAIEGVLREIAKTKKEMKGLKYEQLATEGERIRLSKQSSVAYMLKDRGLEESRVPPIKIIIEDNE